MTKIRKVSPDNPNGITRDIYIVLGAQQNQSKWVIRTYIKPFVNWIWIGAFVLSLGGILSIFDKKIPPISNDIGGIWEENLKN